MLTNLHIMEGDSAHFLRSIDTVDVTLNIDGTHIWDFTDAAIPWDEIDEYRYVKKAGDGLFGGMFSGVPLVSQTMSVLDTTETYLDKNEDGIFGYGFTTVRAGVAAPAKITTGGPARLALFPSVVGDTWFDQYQMVSGQATAYVNSWVKLADSGQVYTPLDSFPCVVARLHQEIEVKVFGVTIERIKFYRYDWLVDSLTTVASIISGNDETLPIFTKALSVSRVTTLSFYQPETTVCAEEPKPRGNGSFVRYTADGFRVVFQLPRSSPVRLTLFDTGGRQVAETRLGVTGEGRHEILWPVKVSTGVYFLKFEGGNQASVAKVVSIR